MKLFFKRASEMQPILSKLLVKCIEDDTYLDIQEKALFYYELLYQNLQEVFLFYNKKIILLIFQRQKIFY